MPLYRIVWNDDENQRGYSVANSILELATKIAENEAFRGEVTRIEMTSPYPESVQVGEKRGKHE
jgi:hypothetical protein